MSLKGGQADEKRPRGITICPSQITEPYVLGLLRALGLDTMQPPSGWLECLIEALQTSGEQTFLLLDDFVSSKPEDVDVRLLEALKASIRDTNVTVVALSQSKDSANVMLTKNGLVGIEPLPQCLSDPSRKLFHTSLYGDSLDGCTLEQRRLGGSCRGPSQDE